MREGLLEGFGIWTATFKHGARCIVCNDSIEGQYMTVPGREIWYEGCEQAAAPIFEVHCVSCGTLLHEVATAMAE